MFETYKSDIYDDIFHAKPYWKLRKKTVGTIKLYFIEIFAQMTICCN